MPRTHARLHIKTWVDPDFRALTADAQRLYFLLLSQPDVNHCGVLTYRPRRWALLACDTEPEDVEKALTELEEHGYVLVDRGTEEVWVRSFIRHDGIITSPNMLKAMWSALDGVLSEGIRKGFDDYFAELDGNGLVKGSEKSRGGEGVGVGEGAKPFPHSGCAECDGSGFIEIGTGIVKACPEIRP